MHIADLERYTEQLFVVKTNDVRKVHYHLDMSILHASAEFPETGSIQVGGNVTIQDVTQLSPRA